jgi:hypothetical protein
MEGGSCFNGDGAIRADRGNKKFQEGVEVNKEKEGWNAGMME